MLVRTKFANIVSCMNSGVDPVAVKDQLIRLIDECREKELFYLADLVYSSFNSDEVVDWFKRHTYCYKAGEIVDRLAQRVEIIRDREKVNHRTKLAAITRCEVLKRTAFEYNRRNNQHYGV